MNIIDTVKQSFETYAKATIKDRALVDARDFLKPSARMCLWAQFEAKVTHNRPFVSSQYSVGAALKHYYTHGNASCYALLTRFSKPFVTRYCLEDFDGNNGSISMQNSEAAERYTKMRLSKLASLLFKGIEKDGIEQWVDNYDNTVKLPSVFPSLGYYNIVNGTTGIATAVSSSIPPFNLKEVNYAMIKLLHNPDIDFEEIYCAPDFPSNGIILNGDEVKQSLKNGTGKSIRIRGKIEYNEKEHCLLIKEIPFQVYVETICKEIEKWVNDDPTSGISGMLDISKATPNVKVFLEKGNKNIEDTIKKLMKNTSIQSFFPVQLRMLDGGAKPRIFTWREALQAHIDHEVDVRTRIHKFEIAKIEKRIHIIDGFLIAIANMEEVIKIIKTSASIAAAKIHLSERFGFSEIQSTEVVNLKLGRLAKLEVQSFHDELTNLNVSREHHINVLSNRSLLNKEIEDDMLQVANEFGDTRKTEVLNICNEESNIEDIVEEEKLIISITNRHNVYTEKETSLIAKNRRNKGNITKLKNEFLIRTFVESNYSDMVIITSEGRAKTIRIVEIENGSNLKSFIDLNLNEIIVDVVVIDKTIPYTVLITKNGMLKKIETKELLSKRKAPIVIMKIKEGDCIVAACQVSSEELGILASSGHFIRFASLDINPIGRAAMGVAGMKLDNNSFIKTIRPIIKDSKYIISLTKKGKIKKTESIEFSVSNRNTKGTKICKIEDGDEIVDFIAIKDEELILSTNKTNKKIVSTDINATSRNSIGVGLGDESLQYNSINISL